MPFSSSKYFTAGSIIDTADVIPAKSSEIKNINPSAEPTAPSSPKSEARETKISPGPSLALTPGAT